MGRENAILIQVTLIPYLKASGEMKTKPTQMSVKQLQSMGIWPDILVCRSDYPIDEKMKEKIGLFCNVKKEHVLQNLDAPSLYEVPMMMEEEHLAQAVCECLNLPCPEPNLADWKKMLEDLRHPTSSVTIALVGKYVALHDAYLSVAEALKHGGIANRTQVNIRWIDAEELTPENLENICTMWTAFWYRADSDREERKERFLQSVMQDATKFRILDCVLACSLR